MGVSEQELLKQRREIERADRRLNAAKIAVVWSTYREFNAALKEWGKVAGQSASPLAGLGLPLLEKVDDAYHKWRDAVRS